MNKKKLNLTETNSIVTPELAEYGIKQIAEETFYVPNGMMLLFKKYLREMGVTHFEENRKNDLGVEFTFTGEATLEKEE